MDAGERVPVSEAGTQAFRAQSWRCIKGCGNRASLPCCEIDRACHGGWIQAGSLEGGGSVFAAPDPEDLGRSVGLLRPLARTKSAVFSDSNDLM